MQNIRNNKGNTGMYILIAVLVILVIAGGSYAVLNYKKLFPPKFTTQESSPEVVAITKEDAQKYIEYYQSYQKIDLSVVQDIESLFTKNNSGKYIINQDKTKLLTKINQSQTDIENLDLPSIYQDEINSCITSRKVYIDSLEENLNTIETSNEIDENSFSILGDFLKTCKELANKQTEAQVIIKGEK